MSGFALNIRIQSKNHWGFETFELIYSGYCQYAIYQDYTKYCYNNLRRKDYTIKLKRTVLSDVSIFEVTPKEVTITSPTSMPIIMKLILCLP